MLHSTDPESDVRSATRGGSGGRSRPARGTADQWREMDSSGNRHLTLADRPTAA